MTPRSVPRAGARVQRAPVAKASANEKVAAFGAASLAAVTMLSQAPAAKADLTEDLLQKSRDNKELNDQKRQAVSNANVERARTVKDGSCKFPENIMYACSKPPVWRWGVLTCQGDVRRGCENAANLGKDVKFIRDKKNLECQGNEDRCPERPARGLPPFIGL